MATSQLEAANARLDQSHAALLPQVGLQAGAGWNDEAYRDPSERSRYGTHGYGVLLTQPLYRRDRAVQVEQADLFVKAAQLRMEAARQDLVLRVARAYIGVLQARAKERACVSQVEAATAQRLRVDRLLTEGAATQPDADDVQARVDGAKAQCAAGRGETALRLEALRQIGGPIDGTLLDLGPDVALQPPLPADMGSWAAAARQDNLEARAASVASEISKREIDLQRSTRLPSVELIGVHGRFSQGGGILFGLPIPSNTVTQTSVGVQLTVPLFTSGAIAGRVRQAAASREIAEDQAEEARREAALGARQAYTAIVSGLERIHADEQALASGRSTLASTQLAFEVGRRLNIDVLNAQQQLAGFDQQLQQARYDTLLAQLQLKAMAGTLDDEELSRVNELLRSP